LQRAYKYKSDDVFQSFMDAYTTSVDPHTDYFGATASAEFDISMKLSLVGIGAVLQERDDYTTIRELVAGGPAQLSGKLAVGDRITGVGQGESGPLKEVVGTRLDEIVQMIRGEKDFGRALGYLAGGCRSQTPTIAQSAWCATRSASKSRPPRRPSCR
jgi:carboxyl-terminal processing protease